MALNLAEVIAQWRWASHLELKEAAERIGLSPATLSRVEKGEGLSGDSLAIVVTWLLGEAPPLVNLPATGQARLQLGAPK